MLDSWPPQLRHAALLLIMALLTWAGTDLVPWLEGQAGWGALAAALATGLLAYFTPLVGQYGLFQTAPAQESAKHVADEA